MTTRGVLAAVIVSVCGLAASAQTLPNGVAAGDTTQNSSVLWTRSTVLGPVNFEVSTTPDFSTIIGSFQRTVTDATLPVKVDVANLTPGTQYYYRATDAANSSSQGRFRTNAASGRNGFRMGVSGDWRGELAPYPAVKNVPGRNLDLWVGLGDTIYADVASPDVPVPQATTLPEFRAKHNEVYGSRYGANTLRDLRQSTSILVNIDDHEVTNDFAGGAHPSSDPRFAGQPGNYINETTLYGTGLQAFHEYNPIRSETYGPLADPRMSGKTKLYRERSFGQDAAVFSLDARSFRDQGLPAANPLDPGSVANYIVTSMTATNRTMLGTQQVSDVKAGLLSAQQAGTTWKFVMVPEPIQNLGVLGASDRFEGYAAERNDLLRYIDTNNIENVVFVAADIHGTLVNNLSYQNVPFGPQISTGAFEITTGSVAYDAPFGPTVVDIATQLGVLTPQQQAFYQSLPLAQREGFIQNLINAQITPLGYDPLGLQGSDIQATLLQGQYTATSTFGWTEFDVDPVTQELLVTTWGILPYTQAQLDADPAAILARDPFIVSQFRVTPVPAPGAGLLLAMGGVLAARRRR
ncbi:MAG: alkaline phosphatase D family protein [Planctomycetota bacterium]|nr:alkaline phosphatase D family protein [Planctomycetota bacterium]